MTFETVLPYSLYSSVELLVIVRFSVPTKRRTASTTFFGRDVTLYLLNDLIVRFNNFKQTTIARICSQNLPESNSKCY